VTRLLAFVIVGAALLLLFFWIAQRRMIYFPFGEVPSPPEVGLSQVETVAFRTDDGLTLNGWFVPARPPATGDTVLVFNGNAGNRAYRSGLAAALSRHGLAVLLFDYRGYGDNPGSPSEAGLTSDARAARAYLGSRGDIDARRIVYFGESLGGAVAIRLATEQRPRALILRSPFTSLVDTGRYHYPFLPVGLLLRDRFPSIDFIARVGCPVLVVAAARDSIVPTEQSRRLFEAAVEPKRFSIVNNADHNDAPLVEGPQLVEAVRTFLSAIP
jgi:uncharacterized protein